MFGPYLDHDSDRLNFKKCVRQWENYEHYEILDILNIYYSLSRMIVYYNYVFKSPYL